MKKHSYIDDGVLRTIQPYIVRRDVLDIGCVEHTLENKNKDRIWVHGFLREHASVVTGIDIQRSAVDELRRQGYNVECQSAESFQFERTFEVIFAGELIEHLGKPGSMLECCLSHLGDDGTLILTTPNAFSLNRLYAVLRRFTNDPAVNFEHTAWYSPAVMRQLLARYGLRIENMFYVDYPKIRRGFRDRVINILCRIFGDRFRETMIVVARPL